MPSNLMVAEPPARWLERPAAVLDCSVAVAAFFEEENAVAATAALLGYALHAPALLPFEFANVARSKSRAGASTEAVARAMQTFHESRVELHPQPPEALHALALAENLSAYDAAYLALALRLKARLLTYDLRLSAVAERLLGAAD